MIELPPCEVDRAEATWVYVGIHGLTGFCDAHVPHRRRPYLTPDQLADMPEVPARPSSEEGFFQLEPGTRHRLTAEYHLARMDRHLWALGWKRVDEFETDAEEWCMGCGTVPQRGRDSHGDCADCGEDVVWIVKTEEDAHDVQGG